MAAEMNVCCILEGVETAAEFAMLRETGGRYFQGYLLGRPLLDQLVDDATILSRIKDAERADARMKESA